MKEVYKILKVKEWLRARDYNRILEDKYSDDHMFLDRNGKKSLSIREYFQGLKKLKGK